MNRTATLPLLALLVLASCGDAPGDTAPAAGEQQAGADRAGLLPTDFAGLPLGPRIVGPQGPEVVSQLVQDGRALADIVSFVACPAPRQGEPPLDECVPGEQPGDALYTFVHRVTPVASGGDDAAFAGGTRMAFRTALPAPSFAGTIGYDRTQALAALGTGYVISVAQDGGTLRWRIETGDGWMAGEELTFFWQSTRPPAGPAEAYRLETGSGAALGTGPFPAVEESAEETGDASAQG